jgi:hypothetical protein
MCELTTDIGKFAYQYLQRKISETELGKKMKERLCKN